MAARLHEIVAELDTLLDAHGFDDYCPNGLQVEGRAEVASIVSGVSASVELFERALEARADAVLVHHGIFWRGDPQQVVGPLKRRLQLLLAADVSLLAYHLPLDAHEQFGNNALLARALGAVNGGPFAQHHGRAIGCVADFANGCTLDELIARVRVATEREPLVFDGGPTTLRRIGVCSGAGTDYAAEAAAAGLDGLLTGEPAERSMAQARESGIHLIAAGHYATERLGVQALGAHVAERYGVEHRFLEVPNPV